MATPQAVRRWIMTGAVAAITMTGTIYGATLKGDREVVRVRLCLQLHVFFGVSILILTFAGEETRPGSHS
jgi:cytochrome b561